MGNSMTSDKLYDFYFSYKCCKYNATKRYFKGKLFNHAVEHGKSTDHIHWDDLMLIGTGTYDNVTISKNNR
jgi:hypothetical protein